MVDKRLSIIIPAYNAEKFLLESVNSCFKQNLKEEEYEVIIVDDGSTDNTAKLADLISTQHHNIKVIHEGNGGLSVARNKGIMASSGKYIQFLDADDSLVEGSLKKALEKAERQNVDICCYLMIVENPNGYKYKQELIGIEKEKVYSGEKALIRYNPVGSCCNRLFKLSFFYQNHLRFFPGISHEDAEFSVKAFSLAKSVIFTNIYAYIYEYHVNSMVRTKEFTKVKKNVFDNIIIVRNILDFAESNKNLSVPLKKHLRKLASSSLVSTSISLKIQKEYRDFGFFKEFIRDAKSNNLYPLRYFTLSWKTTLLIPFLNIISYFIKKK